jgi:hypothetical protein
VNAVDKDYKGVKGWLLLLSVSLAILDPLAGLINIMAVTSTLKPYFEKTPELFKLVLIGGVCSICLLVYSMYAGMSLWRVSPNAVTSAKRYLVVLFHYSFFSIFLPQLVGLSEKTQSEIYQTSPIGNLIVMLYASMWYLYLKKSKRVRATYNEDSPAVL